MQVRYYLTRHAVERARANGITVAKAVWMLHNSVKEKMAPGISRKRAKYGERQQDVYYLRYETYVFVMKPDQEETEKQVCLTLYDQRLNRIKPLRDCFSGS